jgi:hypothetical protein
MLAPPQPSRATEHRKIDKLDRVTILYPTDRAAPETRRAWPPRLDMHLQRQAGHINDAEDRHIGQANKQLADASRVTFQQGLPNSTM